jgi:hemolysin III
MNEKKEEFANALIHGLGAILFLAAAPVLLAYTFHQGESKVFWPVIVFIFCLLTTYVTSTVYHAVTHPDYKRVLRIFDHISIFLLIGGTFTPIVYYNMGDWNGVPFLLVFWGVLACGMILKIFFTGKYKALSTIFYVGVAWMGAMFSGPLLHNLPRQILYYLLLGGAFYTAGTFFYMRKKLLYHHAFWHLFVLAGSVSHFFAISVSLVR